MRRAWVAAAAVSTVLTGLAEGAPARAETAPVLALTKLATKLPAGAVWATLQSTVVCSPDSTLRSDGLLRQEELAVFTPIFAKSFVGASVAGGEATNLFEAQDQPSPAYQIGGLIHEENISVCARYKLLNPSDVKNEVRLAVQWQIYSNIQAKVVATIETSATAKFVNDHIDGAEGVRRAFSENVKALSSTPAMKALLAAAASDAGALGAKVQARITTPAPRPAPRTPAEAIPAVVLIATPSGHGSGVLVSSDGYILTDAHVVESNQAVKVRWSDGVETDGRVLRVHKQRDVALIKAEPHGQAPLVVRDTPVQPGEGVFAIGAPFEKDLQGTMTRGIVSASRIVNGYGFIQSDVTVSPGNSGGPLIDEKGAVIGLTDWGYRPEGMAAGLNFFIPIRDALDFLNLDLTPASGAQPPASTTAALKAGAGASVR